MDGGGDEEMTAELDAELEAEGRVWGGGGVDAATAAAETL